MLAPGTKLGSYEIISSLGAGGMGEVYRARDLRLGRTIAIKILPPSCSEDPERLRRFETEARSASALNHPNIVTIHDLGHHGSTHYIAMELVEGKTLRELLSGPLPIRRTIEIGAQIADGLTKAHEAGIAHRDLKPENLMVSEDGFVKILDFGLAKLEGLADAPDPCTTSGGNTPAGLVLGTVGYMSPEQASGEGHDFRSDQFSFGLVIYEMVTGKRAFHRKTAAETLVAILREPHEPVGALQPDTPPPLIWIIDRCLAKEPGQRYASTRDLARELATLRDSLADRPVLPKEERASNIPVQRTAFVGRDRELGAIVDLLLRPEVRLVTITGPGGIGKSRLAVQAVNSAAERFSGGVYFLALYALHDPASVPAALVQALGIRESGGQSATELLKDHFQNRSRLPTLLLLDNFEHLIQAAPITAELLAMSSDLKILVTSRSALRVYGEHEFPVPPLALPESKATSSPDVLAEYPAIALFVQRAVAARPDFLLTRENASAITDICARLDGLPLAIELAAARLKVLSPSALRTRLASRLKLLTGGARDLPQRQQTLRAAMDWSYDLLTPEEQKLFRRLAVFVGGCNLEAVEAVCDTRGDLGLDLLDGMASMVDKSLVQQVQHQLGESRFHMLETVREYALEKLEAAEETRLARRAHAAYCLVLAEEGATETAGDQALWQDRLSAEHDNFRAALDWLIQTGDAEWGLRLGAALFRYWEASEYLTEGRDSLDKLLRLPAAASATKLRARAVFAAGVLAAEQGDYGPADALMTESLEIARRFNDVQGAAVSLNALAVNARDSGDLVLAHSRYQQSLSLWKELDDQRAIATSLSNLANVVKLDGDFKRAHDLYSECRELFDKLGDRAGVAWTVNYQGDVARDRGDSLAAQTLYEQALHVFRELDDRWGIAGTLADLGSLAREQQEFSSAEALYSESIRIFQKLDHKRGVARLLEGFACSAALQRKAQRALRLAGAAAAIRQNIGTPLSPAEQSKLEAALQPVRQEVTDPDGASAWLQGWAMPLEDAVAEALSSAPGLQSAVAITSDGREAAGN
jgi:predicted ATPase